MAGCGITSHMCSMPCCFSIKMFISCLFTSPIPINILLYFSAKPFIKKKKPTDHLSGLLNTLAFTAMFERNISKD